MWSGGTTASVPAATSGGTTKQRCCACSGSPSRRSRRRCGSPRRRSTGRALEITTCLRRARARDVIRNEPRRGCYEALVAKSGSVTETLFSPDGTTIDDQVAELLGDQLAVGESCTAGLVAARLRSGRVVGVRPGRRRRLFQRGEHALLGVEPGADRGIRRSVGRGGGGAGRRGDRAFRRDVGVGLTGVAGPGGGTEERPVGRVLLRLKDSAVGSGAYSQSACRAPAPTSGTGPRRWRCIFFGGCCSARRGGERGPARSPRARLFVALDLLLGVRGLARGGKHRSAARRPPTVAGTPST